jgi:hypothetical protein
MERYYGWGLLFVLTILKPKIYGLGRIYTEGFVIGEKELIISVILIIIFVYLVWKYSSLK